MKKFIILLFLIFICFSASKIFALDKVEINTASLAQLDEITGIGPVLAQRIVDARPFSSVDDLLRVSGIGEKTLQKIKDQGLAYVEEQNQQPAQETNLAPTPVLLPTPTPIPTPSPTPAPAITYPSRIVFNEILPSPEGADETEEWFEIHNNNSFEVDLSGWKIQDTEGTTVIYIIPDGTKIEPNGYLVLTRPKTKITLNNTGDKLELLQPDENIADSIEFGKSSLNLSYNRIGSSWE